MRIGRYVLITTIFEIPTGIRGQREPATQYIARLRHSRKIRIGAVAGLQISLGECIAFTIISRGVGFIDDANLSVPITAVIIIAGKGIVNAIASRLLLR